MTIKREYTMTDALRKARDGAFEFSDDARYGANEIRYYTPTGKFKTKLIYIKDDRKHFAFNQRRKITATQGRIYNIESVI